MKTILLFMLACIVPLNVGATMISAKPSDAVVNIGDAFTVDLVADFSLDESVIGWGLDLNYDSTLVSQVGAPTIGSAWLPAFSPDGDGLAGLAFPLSVTGTDVLLATLSFEAVSVGSVDFILDITALDFTEGLPLAFPAPPGSFADLTFNNASVSVTTVPEPSTMLLMAAGIAGLRLAGRKK